MKKVFIFLLIGAMASSCVTKKKFNEVNTKLSESQQTNAEQCNDIVEMRKHISLLQYDSVASQKTMEKIIADSVAQSKTLHQAELELSDMKKLNQQLTDRLTNSKSDVEIKALLTDLQKAQEKLQTREDALNKAEKDLQTSSQILTEKEKNLSELQSIVNRQDSLMKNLRKRVSDALRGFEGNGLEVINKNGKVYVSLEEQLLFKSGKWDVDSKGVNALNNLATFLAENKDINVVIEGHTDDVPYKGNGNILDNWDLSVKRATAIVRILLNNKGINPTRVSATGRAEFVPLDSSKTAAARTKNRRTEIILSPDMDELLKALSAE